jgi:hypothetical protein
MHREPLLRLIVFGVFGIAGIASSSSAWLLPTQASTCATFAFIYLERASRV